MELRTQIATFGLGSALLAGGVGGIGLLATSRLGHAIGDTIVASQAQQASQQTDMMHDAIRGDAQMELLGALERNPQRIAETKKPLSAHARALQQAMARLHQLWLPNTSQEAQISVEPLIQQCLDAARAAIRTIVDLTHELKHDDAFTEMNEQCRPLLAALAGQLYASGADAPHQQNKKNVQ